MANLMYGGPQGAPEKDGEAPFSSIKCKCVVFRRLVGSLVVSFKEVDKGPVYHSISAWCRVITRKIPVS